MFWGGVTCINPIHLHFARLDFAPTPCFKRDCNNQLGFPAGFIYLRLKPGGGRCHPTRPYSSRVSGSDLRGGFGKPVECFTLSGNSTSGWMGDVLQSSLSSLLALRQINHKKPELFDSRAQLRVLFLLTSAEMCHQNQLSALTERVQPWGAARSQAGY